MTVGAIVVTYDDGTTATFESLRPLDVAYTGGCIEITDGLQAVHDVCEHCGRGAWGPRVAHSWKEAEQMGMIRKVEL